MRAVIAGNGVSGKSAFNYLKQKGFEVEFVEEKYINPTNKKLLNNKYYDRLLSNLSFLVISPGISLESNIVIQAKKRKIKIISELELGANNLQGNTIAITGTNGKTTTVSLIHFLLSSANYNCYLGGNIGTAVTSFADKTTSESISVLECSSYQLESSNNFKPKISAILNISEDHLARHKTMENYIASKYKITTNQTSEDYLLINADCELLLQNMPKTNAKILYFSTKKKVFGCFIKNNSIYFNDNLKIKKLVSLNNIKLIGEHNLSNILCAVFAVFLQTNNKNILKNISNFHAVNHRIEFVQNINNVSFYNDSKATNIDSTLVALKCFNCPINLILGGSDKGYNFDLLFENIANNVENIAVFGETKQKIIKSAEKYNFKNIYKFNDLKSCALACYNLASENSVVLLSPACASFDQFNNYEERGNVFKKIVKELSISENINNKTTSQK